MRVVDTLRLGLAPFLVLVLCCGGQVAFPPSAQHPLLARPLPEIHHRQTLDGQPVDSLLVDNLTTMRAQVETLLRG